MNSRRIITRLQFYRSFFIIFQLIVFGFKSCIFTVLVHSHCSHSLIQNEKESANKDLFPKLISHIESYALTAIFSSWTCLICVQELVQMCLWPYKSFFPTTNTVRISVSTLQGFNCVVKFKPLQRALFLQQKQSDSALSSTPLKMKSV